VYITMSRADRIYINSAAICAATDATYPPASFVEARGVPIVQNASDFILSVARWQGVGLDLPLFIPSIQLGQTTATGGGWLTTYQVQVSVTNSGVTYTGTSTVTWLPQFVDEAVPPPPVTQQNVVDGNRYYWASSYWWVLNLFNVAIQAAYTSAASQLTAATKTTTNVYAPVLVFANGTFNLVFDARGWGPAPTDSGNTWNLNFNAPAMALFNGFPYAPVLHTNGAWNQIVQYNSGSTASTTVGRVSASPTFTLPQEFFTGDTWSPVDSIVFATTMPVENELQAQLATLGADAFQPSVALSMFPTWTDLALPLSGGASDYLGKFTYVPSGEYRRVSLMSTQPLQNIQWTVFWRNRMNDGLYQVRLQPGGSVSVKLLLERRVA